MIVTCEACKSRYKIDDAKISGRGARITCPKCRHQFVVFAAEKNEPVKPVTPVVNEWESEEPTRIGMAKQEDPRNLRTMLTAPTEQAPVSTATKTLPKNPAQPARPEVAQETVRQDSRSPARNGLVVPESPMDDGFADGASGVFVRPGGSAFEVSLPPQVQRLTPAEAATRAPTLDFKKVGVSAWKVKVRIGLVYDFSDLKTLRKYIQDGRVTSQDLISWDGKAWKPLGEVPDLDVFFVETYDRLLAEQSGRTDTPAGTTGGVSTSSGSTGSVSTGSVSTGSVSTTPNGPVVTPPFVPENTFTDPFEALKQKQKDKANRKTSSVTLPFEPKKPVPATSGATMALAAAVLVLLVFGGWWVTNRPAVATPANVPAVTPEEASATTPEDVREQINNSIKEDLKPVAEPVKPPVEAPAELKPLRPDLPDGAVPRTPTGKGNTPSVPSTTTAKSSAKDYEAAADSAAGSGNWSVALGGYQKAAQLDGKNMGLQAKLGKAAYKTGDLGLAETALLKAEKSGVGGEVYKYLGHLYRDQGDTSNATYYYQAYLKTKPRDAAEIDAQLKKLTGG